MTAPSASVRRLAGALQRAINLHAAPNRFGFAELHREYNAPPPSVIANAIEFHAAALAATLASFTGVAYAIDRQTVDRRAVIRVTPPLTVESIGIRRADEAIVHMEHARVEMEAACADLCSLVGAVDAYGQLREAMRTLVGARRIITEARETNRVKLDRDPRPEDAMPHAACGQRGHAAPSPEGDK